MKPEKLLMVFIVIVTVPLISVAAFNFYWDPNWIWRNEPVWTSNGAGHNRVMDLKMRAVKPLQLVLQQPEIVVVGSSKVYRGFNTDAVTGVSAYNFGISSMRAREMIAYLDHIERWSKPKKVIILLDYFMFDESVHYETGFDSRITRIGYVPEQLLRTLFSWHSFSDSRLVRSGIDSGDGAWTNSGFKHTCHRTAKTNVRIGSVLIRDYVYPNFDYDALSVLAERVRKLKERGVDTFVYLSPKHDLELDVGNDGQPFNLSRFTEIVTDTFRQVETNLLLGPILPESVRTESVLEGSTKNWIDPLHFDQPIGALLLNMSGVETKANSAWSSAICSMR